MAARKKVASKLDGLVAAPISEKDHESVRIEKIKNGYLVSRSGSRKGSYFEEREYSSTDPLKGVKAAKSKGTR